ncbi:thioredoxin [Massilia violaceinigra]|uniref:Thioredoxin n=1 Tax=Massilia violaceinigra TaxID=2045208 RepID=A0ABY4A456_9BURK|nr:thioredoxin fold domain-containing protein [Massilia violaceinigra]UOD29506.1 thioredoxin [Massilia violaceinigra]
MTRQGAVTGVVAAAGWLRRQAALLAVLALLGTDTMAASVQALAAPTDLGADALLAAQRGQPLLLLFSLPGCGYCDVVRRNYLAPLTRDGAEQTRPVVREVGLAGSTPFKGFDSAAIDGAALAARYQVRIAPTVLLLDARGALLAPPLAGGDVSGMYGAYLDGALAEAQRKIAAQ